MKHSTIVVALAMAFLTAPAGAQQHADSATTDAKPHAVANAPSTVRTWNGSPHRRT